MGLDYYFTLEQGFWLWFAGIILGVGVGMGIQKIIGPHKVEKENDPEILD